LSLGVGTGAHRYFAALQHFMRGIKSQFEFLRQDYDRDAFLVVGANNGVTGGMNIIHFISFREHVSCLASNRLINAAKMTA
jgi:hypothetical protein